MDKYRMNNWQGNMNNNNALQMARAMSMSMNTRGNTMSNIAKGQAGMTENEAMAMAMKMTAPGKNNQRFKPREGILNANVAREVSRYIGAGENSNSILRRVKPLFPSITLAQINAYLGRNRTSGGKSRNRKQKKSRKTRRNYK